MKNSYMNTSLCLERTAQPAGDGYYIYGLR